MIAKFLAIVAFVNPTTKEVQVWDHPFSTLPTPLLVRAAFTGLDDLAEQVKYCHDVAAVSFKIWHFGSRSTVLNSDDDVPTSDCFYLLPKKYYGHVCSTCEAVFTPDTIDVCRACTQKDIQTAPVPVVQ